METIKIPEFETKDELFEFLVENKERLIAQKKASTKHADAMVFSPVFINEKGVANKANEPVDLSDADTIKVRVVINTTNLLDNHSDVHIPKLWIKSLKENKMVMFLQEHKMAFDKIIADGTDLKAFTKTFSWSELGYDFEGETEALVFEATIKAERNNFMFQQYGKGYVKNHSVGMRYVKIVMCVNSDKEYYGAEKEAWDKYYPQVANKELADSRGYFWAVTQAKVIEGSAVPLGSNFATPTLDNNLKTEPSQDTQEQNKEQSQDTLDYDYLSKNFSIN